VKVPDFRSNVPLNLGKYKESWDSTYKKKFESIIEGMDDYKYQKLCDVVGVDDHEDKQPKKVTENREESIFLYSVRRFISDKKKLIQVYSERKGYTIGEDEEFYFILKQIEQKNQFILNHIYLIHRRSKSGPPRTYDIDSELPDEYIELFEENERGLRQSLSKSTRSNRFKYRDGNCIDFDTRTLFVLDRQTSDTEKMDVTGPQRRRNVKMVFIEIDEHDNELRIHTSSQSIREKLIEKLEDYLVISVTPSDLVENEVEFDKFKEELTNSERYLVEEQETPKITYIEFKKTVDSPTIPIKLSRKTLQRDVRKVINFLEDSLVSTDILNVKKMWIQVFGTDAKINLKEPESGIIRLEAKIYSQSPEKNRDIEQKFFEEFGIPLNTDIPKNLLSEELSQVISFIMSAPSSNNIYPAHEPVIEQLEEIGVINVEEKQKYCCKGCRKRYKIFHEECPNCSNELKEFGDSEKQISLSKRGVRNFFKELLDREDLDYQGVKPERIYKTEFRFLHVETENGPVNFLISTNDVSFPPNSLKHLRKTLNPVILLNPGRVMNDDYIDEILFEKIDLSELISDYIDGELEGDIITSKIERVTAKTREMKASNARASHDRLKEIIEAPDESSGNEFEQEVFHVLNHLIPNAKQWGTKRNATVPDGFAELNYRNSGRFYMRSVSWDCKFKESIDSEFDISSGEVGNLQLYINNIVRSEEVENTDSKFRNFVVITNAEDEGKFENKVSDRLNKISKFKGTPVLMDIKFLLNLYNIVNQNEDLIRKNSHEFYRHLYMKLNGGKEFVKSDNEDFVYLKGDDATSMISEFLQEFEEPGLNVKELRETLSEGGLL